MLIKVFYPSTQELDSFINRLEQFGKTETPIVLPSLVAPRNVAVRHSQTRSSAVVLHPFSYSAFFHAKPPEEHPENAKKTAVFRLHGTLFGGKIENSRCMPVSGIQQSKITIKQGAVHRPMEDIIKHVDCRSMD